MKILRLATTINSTSAPYNQFSLGLKDNFNQTFCSLFDSEISISKEIISLSANGSLFKMFKLLRVHLNNNKYDVIHIHSGVTGIIFIFAILPFKFSLLKRTLFTLHNSWPVLRLRNQFLNFIVMLAAYKICTCGTSSRKSIPRFIDLFIRKKTKAIVNGFDNQRIDFIKDSKPEEIHFKSKSKIKIVCVGALNDTKNQISLLKSLKDTQIECEVIFLGDGKKKESLVNYSRAILDPIKITFKGKVSRNLAIEHMLEADISISLSKGEGLPIAVLESMYAGCFVILSLIPPHIEISPPSERCLYVDSSNKYEIKNSLNYVKKHIEDIKKNRLKSKEYSKVNFGLRKMLGEYTQVYKSISAEADEH